jgi:predicted enzyme related to lactoylglutathione lyase
MKNMINWFEIPVSNIDRATAFYANILDCELQQAEMMGMKMAFLPADESAVSGALVQGEDCNPSTSGALVYLNGGNDLQTTANRVEAAGGKLIVPKTQISPEFGFFALFIDTEGNRIGLHSMN